jgi:Flp pilus assembly protein TadG
MSARRARGCHGNVSLLVVIMAPALLMAAGLVLDGGRQLQARRDAGAAAAAAARAATQLSEQELYGTGLDSGLATARAKAELAAQDASGSVAVDGETVVVTVTSQVDYLILPGGRRVSTASSSTPLHGVTAGVAP